jgi:phosphatidylinositol alpha-1,6-mannosyltransferase
MLFFTVKKLVQEHNIRQIMVHHVLPVGYVALLIKKLYHIPFITFLHGTDIDAGTKNTWKKHRCEQVLLGSDKIICNSESLKERVQDLFPSIVSKLSLVYPCPPDYFFDSVDDQDLNTLREQLALSGKRVLVTVSRLAEGKGLPHLVHLIPDILAHVPDLVWLIVGAGPKQEFLIEEIKKLGLQNVVRMVGGIDNSRVPLYMSLGEVFVLLTHPDSTRGEEGFGLVFVEAAACKLPVVAGLSGGVRETVVDGVTGILVPPSDSRVIIDSIVSLFRDSERSKQMGLAAYDRAKKTFQWNNQLHDLLQ